ncbi:MAG: N-acetylneuraminate synthase [Magnetovibrio sp.]|nr:N-acetylneuraminate synthase [Magnetovibrio sp.]|tara:strand:- start:392 stop:1261 length:870 start_codon:yes stop_codon:yes gene_type:complete
MEDFINSSSLPIPKHVFIIGEIGINHNGDIEIAKKLIDMAKSAGCDAVKFQKRTVEIVYTPKLLNSPRESPWGTTLRAQKEGLEFGTTEYNEIDRYCNEKGIEWFASAWDLPSQEFLRNYNCKYNKIASAMTTHKEFIETVAKEGKPTFISVGMCTYSDIKFVVDKFRKYNCPFTLMHTVSEYPVPEERLNLLGIIDLRERFKCPVGYSGHEASVSPSLIAATIGATAIERHITLERAMYGSDQAASLEGPGLRQLVAQVRKIPIAMGVKEKQITDGELIAAKKLRYWD